MTWRPMSPATLDITLELDASGLLNALHKVNRAAARLGMWRWQPSDPNPLPKLHLWRR